MATEQSPSSNALDPEDRVGFLYLLIMVLVGVPMILLGILIVTGLNVRLGQALGVNIPENPNLIIYDVTCDDRGDLPILHITYWMRDSAPITATFGQFESPVVSSPAGIQTMVISIREAPNCPKSVILTDKSRNRRAGSGVEVVK